MRNYDLLEYHKTFAQNNAYNFLLQSKIKDFYKEHGGKINSLNEKVIAIQEKYFQTDGYNERNQLKIKQEQEIVEQVSRKKFLFFFTKEVKTTVPGKMKYVMKEGMLLADYQKEMNALMMQDIVPIHTNGNGLTIVKK